MSKFGIIAFSGRISSGKSTLAQMLSTESGVPIARFSSIIAERARELGRGSARSDLQRVGADWVERDPNGLAERVLAIVEWRSSHGLIVDGLRHLTVLAEMRALARPVPVRVVYVEASKSVRQLRFNLTEPEKRLEDFDAQESEAYITLIRDQADLIVNNDGKIEKSFMTVSNWCHGLT